jgi:hypothetical protein
MPTDPLLAETTATDPDEAPPLLPLPNTETTASCSIDAAGLPVTNPQTCAVHGSGRRRKMAKTTRFVPPHSAASRIEHTQVEHQSQLQRQKRRRSLLPTPPQPLRRSVRQRTSAIFLILPIRQQLLDTCTSGAPALTQRLAHRLTTGEPGHMVGCYVCVCVGVVVYVAQVLSLGIMSWSS